MSNTNGNGSIHSKAMLVSLRLSTWTARKYDKKASKEVADNHGTTLDAGRYNKALIPADSPSYKALTQYVGALRTEHYKQTLAWSDEGWRLLPSANFLQYSGYMRQSKVQFDTCLAEFLQEYPYLRDSARERLNGLYDEKDYPSVKAIERKFGFYLDFSPMPSSGDFRLDLPSEEVALIQGELDGRVASAVADAMRDAWKRLFDCVSHIRERLADPKAIFRDSLISNASELCDVLGRLNVTGDANLDAMCNEVKEYIASNNPDDLRENDSLRQDTALLADDLVSRMAAFYQPEVEEN